MKLFITINLTLIASITLLAGCISSGGGGGDGEKITLDDPNPSPTVAGTKLACGKTLPLVTSDIAATLFPEAPDSIPTFNVSREQETLEVADSHERPNIKNSILRLTSVVEPQLPDGSRIDVSLDEWTGEDYVHPVLVGYTEQVFCDAANLPAGQTCYELGDGSADIGDPFHIDDPYVSISLDNGKSWKKEKVGDTANIEGASYMAVPWDVNHDGVVGENETIPYPGHSHKSATKAKGNNILIAWLDKYCPSGNPYDLEQSDDSLIPYPDDLYQVNGTQGSIDYGLSCANVKLDPTLEYGDLDYDCAPNGKEVYEVPFSCVWAARGVLVADPEDAEGDGYKIQWRKAEQLTSGRRDTNKIWIASAEIGFAITWQEDPEGLREGKGEGPGVGWSGATTNHGADIWYSYITMDDFVDVIDDTDVVIDDPDPSQIAALATKPKPAVKFAYPVRVTDNDACFPDGDSKLYCTVDADGDGVTENCIDSTLVESNNQRDDNIQRCITGDVDQLATFQNEELTYATLDGDTGASRPAITILKTNGTTAYGEDEYITLLGYEETKGLADTEPGVSEPGLPADIEVEGKMVYFESFPWNDPVTISSGNIVNGPVPRFDPDTLTYPNDEDLVFENARRLVIMNQLDPCEQTDTSHTFGFMYKEGYDTKGGQSDMYIRLNTGFTWEEFEDTVTCVSCQTALVDDPQVAETDVTWSIDNLLEYSGDNPYDNTFSPRGHLRGDEIFTGFMYTVNWDKHENGQVPGNFAVNRFSDDDGGGIAWQGTQQVTFEKGGHTAEDPRLVPTLAGLGIVSTPAGVEVGQLASDISNPDVWFMSYGSIDMVEGPLDVFYMRSTDKGRTWEYVARASGETEFAAAHLSAKDGIEEKEAEGIANPDGTMFFNIWVQESVTYDPSDPFSGLETWLGRIDYNSDVVPDTLCLYTQLDEEGCVAP